jgi:cytosine permease
MPKWLDEHQQDRGQHDRDGHHLHAPAEDFSVERVPEDQTVHGLRVALVLIGIAITIPAFLTGAELGLAMGLDKVGIAIPAGSLFLCVIGCLAAVIAAQSRLTTYMIIQFSFGSSGAKLVNLIISITIFGWFTVTASFFGESIQQAMIEIWGIDSNLSLLIIIGSLLVVATTVFGFKAIDKLALLAVPLLFAALIVLVYLALEDTTLVSLRGYSNDAMKLGQGITAVIGGFIVGAVIMPDYCRYVRNTKHGLLAAVLHFGVAYPLILLMLAVVSIHSGEKNFIHIMTGMGFGVVGLLVLIFATWTTNTGNLYSNSLVLKTIFTPTPQWLLVILAGGLGTILAVVGITHYFIAFLLFLGISIPPVAGIYIADYFFVHKRNYRIENLARQPAIAYPAFIAWMVATVAAYLSTSGWITLTTIPACDAIGVAFFVYLLDNRLMGEGRKTRMADRASV